LSYALYSIYLCLPFYANRLNILFSKNLILCTFFFIFCSIYFVLCTILFISIKHSLNVSCSLHSIICIILYANNVCTCFLCSVSHSCSLAVVYFYKISFNSFNLIFSLYAYHYMHIIICISSYKSKQMHLCISSYIICITFLYFNLYFSFYAFYSGLKIWTIVESHCWPTNRHCHI
jgi:hypothetical protein